ncbi:MAG: 3-phosphoshikimate 1-carboxyvinyltransferase [Thermoplasmata archaeon]|nr:3-phosphoshikimate 1-carboxyvinyltransferase [Thermoplasmata archaeon]
MTRRRIVPGNPRGTVRAPPSKSYTHRAVVVAHLAGRPFQIRAPLRSADTLATARGIEQLGSVVEIGNDRWNVRPRPSKHRPGRTSIDCDESGTTLRFLTAVAARSSERVRFRGGGRLPFRPMGPLIQALSRLGAKVELPAGSRSLPFAITGPIHSGRIGLDASVSSQFSSALLFVLPLLSGDSQIDLRGPRVSGPYIDATNRVLEQNGIRVERDHRWIRIPGDQSIRGDRFVVPGDASSAAYLWAAAAVAPGDVTVEDIAPDLPQADAKILDILASMGARVGVRGDGARVQGPIHDAVDVDLTDAPDLYPLVGTLMSTVEGTSVLRGADHARLKESDRRTQTIGLARALGARVQVRTSSLWITGSRETRPLRLRSLRDHRVVMSAAVGALASNSPSEIGDSTAVRKSYPGFWETLKSLGITARKMP